MDASITVERDPAGYGVDRLRVRSKRSLRKDNRETRSPIIQRTMSMDWLSDESVDSTESLAWLKFAVGHYETGDVTDSDDFCLCPSV